MIKGPLYISAVIAALLAIGTTACVTAPPVDAVHNAKNNLDWTGTYSGRIPAASGPGIDVTITLRRDQTFTLTYDYVDRPDSITGQEGTFDWDETGNVIVMKIEYFPPYYRAGEDHLLQLDLKGQIITGNLAELYVLKKMPQQ